jgi:hypothetical protein
MPTTLNSFELKQRAPGVRHYCGRFTTNATADPDIVIGEGYTVAYSATGVFTITFDQYFDVVLCAQAFLNAAATTEVRASVTSFTAGSSAANATLVISTAILDTGAYVADASSDGDYIHFEFYAQKLSENSNG